MKLPPALIEYDYAWTEAYHLGDMLLARGDKELVRGLQKKI